MRIMKQKGTLAAAPVPTRSLALCGLFPIFYNEFGFLDFLCGRNTVRSLINTLLACLILACPFLCGADEVGHSVQHEHARKGDAPAHCPENSDNCVCRGAVQASDVRATAPDAGASAPLFLVAPPPFVAHPLHHLTWEGEPTGLASWGDSLTIRALLQNFRF